ncbi:MAG: DinB family protein [Phycisphaerae bacterium]
MQFNLQHAVEILQRTPSVLRAMLSGLSAPWVSNNYGVDTFSPFDVVGHLIHGEKTDWMVRVRMILDDGESQAFAPFDRYAMYEASKGRTIDELLREFAELRAENLVSLAALHLDATNLALRGTHPAFGSVTLEQLLATWVVHDLNHIHQIAKSMAYQYREAVGPWREYLSILPRG